MQCDPQLTNGLDDSQQKAALSTHVPTAIRHSFTEDNSPVLDKPTPAAGAREANEAAGALASEVAIANGEKTNRKRERQEEPWPSAATEAQCEGCANRETTASTNKFMHVA